MPDEAVAPVPDCSGSVSNSRPPPKLSGTPRQSEGNKASTAGREEPKSILSVSVRTVNQYAGADNDAKYTDALVRARKNADEAGRCANEMVDAISCLKSPEAAAKADAETNATIRSDADDGSVFTNTAKPEIFLSVFVQIVNQYVGAGNDANYTDDPLQARKNAVEAERRAKEMEDAMSWLKSPEAAAKAAAEWTQLFGATPTMAVASTADEAELEIILSVFLQIVNRYAGADNIAKSTSASVRARKNAVEAERRAKEMEDGMSWLKEPRGSSQSCRRMDATIRSDADDDSTFSNDFEFKTSDNEHDMMTMIRQNQAVTISSSQYPENNYR